MIGHAASLETLSTTTEKEALLLEASLIKKHRPHYNIVLRDDKQYVLFRIAKDAPYPRLEVVRQARRDNARYFGPFTSGQAARETWKTIHRVFPLRRCVDRAFKNRVRPCLYHHIGQCLAPCTENVPVEEYASLIHRVELLLSGRSRELLDTLRHAMADASEAMNYEQAAVFRDQIKAIERTVERQSVVLPEGGNMDVAGVAPAKGGLALGLLFVREGRLVDGRTFFWPDLELAEGPELLWSFLGQFYGPQTSIPPRIVVPWLPADTVLPGMVRRAGRSGLPLSGKRSHCNTRRRSGTASRRRNGFQRARPRRGGIPRSAGSGPCRRARGHRPHRQAPQCRRSPARGHGRLQRPRSRRHQVGSPHVRPPCRLLRAGQGAIRPARGRPDGIPPHPAHRVRGRFPHGRHVHPRGHGRL